MAQRPLAGQRSLPRLAALILLWLGVLSGCASTSSSPTWRSTPLAGNWVTIQRGDTLGAIARRADIPLVRVKRFNPGVDPHRLAVGQRLLVPSKNERAPSGGPYRYQVRPGDTYSSIARRFGTTAGRIQSANPSVNPNTLRVGQLLQVPLNGGSHQGAKPSTPQTARPAPPSLPPAAGKRWPWPLEEYRVARSFGTDSRGTLQPMLLSTSEGNSARVVADGQVRFANSMRQLGQVVIVHHSDNLQTVYALCGELKVHKGQQLTAGTPVCSVGYSSATERHDLLFDVRHGGKPIDPRKVLR